MARWKQPPQQPPHQSRSQHPAPTTSSTTTTTMTSSSSTSTSVADAPTSSSTTATSTTFTDAATSSSSDTGSSSASSAANTDTTASSSTTTTGSATSTTSMANSGMAASTMLPYISDDGSCLFLDGNTPCGADFEGYPVALAGLEYSFADYPGFVQLIGNLTDSTAVAASLTSLYGCAAGAALDSAVAGLRYRASYYCTELVYESISLGICQSSASATSASSVSSSSSTSAAAVYTDSPILCASTCSLAESTLSSVILNSTLCSNTAAANAAVNTTAAYCKAESALAASGSCLSAVKLETSTCGFSTQTDATAGCPSIAATDTCCAALLASSTSSTSANSSSASGPNLAVIAGSAVAGVLVVLAVTVAAAFLLRSRFNARKASATPEGSGGGSAASSAGFAYQPLRDQRPPSAAASHVSFNPVPSPSPSAMIVPTSATAAGAPFLAVADPSVTRDRGPLPTPIRDTQFSSYSGAAPSLLPGPAAPGTMLRVRFPYTPTLPDELPLQAGRDVLLLYAFDDGWALGLDPASRRQGTFPMACCAAGDSLDRPGSTATGTAASDSMASWESLTAGVHPQPRPNLARRASSVSASVRSTASDIARSYLRSSGYDVDFDDHTDGRTSPIH
ncbi:hypothetical protein HK405_010806 [Cladochytrium tenue]|nr:hypothetical protein HK405_010806 [Cladochytrium tenue]